jgi:hypothetical protein
MNERIVAKSGSFRKASIRCRLVDYPDKAGRSPGAHGQAVGRQVGPVSQYRKRDAGSAFARDQAFPDVDLPAELEPPLLAAKAVRVGTHFAFGAKASCIDIGVYAPNNYVHMHPCQDLRKEQFQLRPCPDQKIATASPSDPAGLGARGTGARRFIAPRLFKLALKPSQRDFDCWHNAEVAACAV